jgi:hypothetical protein
LSSPPGYRKPVDPPDPSDSTKPNATPDAPKAAPSASTTNEPTEPNVEAAGEEFEHQKKPSDWPGVDEAFEKVAEEEFRHQKPADWPALDDGAFEHQDEAPSAAGHRAEEAYFDEICKDASSPLDPNIETPQVSDPDDDKEDDDTTDKAEELPLPKKKIKKKTKHTPIYVERTNNKTASLKGIKVKASTLEMSKKAREKKKQDMLNKRRKNKKKNSE